MNGLMMQLKNLDNMKLPILKLVNEKKCLSRNQKKNRNKNTMQRIDKCKSWFV